MAGKKARCSCGTVVRLGPKKSGDRQRVVPGDEQLGDQLLGGDLTDFKSVPVDSVPAVPPNLPALKPKSESKRGRRATKPARKRDPDPIGDQPLFDQSYSDLDDILAGAGDASPVVARPKPTFQPRTATGATGQKSAGTTKRRSSIGFLAALGSATLAFWFGIFVAVSRFQMVDRLLLSDLSMHLQSAYSATFENADVPHGFQILFVSLGWLLSGVAVALVILGVAQFINAIVTLLINREPISWADGLTGTLGVSALFLMVALVFSQASFANQEHRQLDAYEKPVVAANEQLENVSRLRAKIDSRNKAFTTAMLVGAAVPMSIFVLSMVRLFSKTSSVDTR